MSNVIYSAICPLHQVLGEVKKIWQEENFLSDIKAELIIEKELKPYLDTLQDSLFAIVEYPYVDKMYRDTFYSFYSSKLAQYHRNSIRISFFDTEVSIDDFLDGKRKKILQDNNSYLGFMTLRPTFPKIIGRTALSPKAKKENGIICCLAKISSTVNSAKFKVSAFPHSSQDNQTITCAETTIWALLEYFGNKYPEYKPVLPSTIHKILHLYSFKRLMPSEGLSAEQVTYAVRELGFGAMIYSKKRLPDSFDSIISTYVESGIPVIAVLFDETTGRGHAVNIVGREIESPERVMSASPVTIGENNGNRFEIIDFNRVERRYVFIDDNQPPYQCTNLTQPYQEYHTDKRWHGFRITNIIVPLYSKIYLEANTARHNFLQYLKHPIIGISGTEVRITKTFLASSRSYKEYLALNPDLDKNIKLLFLGLTMPKFVWVMEIARMESYEKGVCDGIILLDATEPIKHIDSSVLGNLSLIVSFLDGSYVTRKLGNFQKISSFAHPFASFKSNLR